MSMAWAVRRGLLHSALTCILPTALLTGAVAQLCATRFGLDAAYPLKVMSVFVAGAALVLSGLPRHHPFGSFGPANQVTVARGALVALLAGLIGERAATGTPLFATVLAVVAAALDGVDGWLARRTHTASRFGARFDMETDALLILVLAVLVWQYGKAGAWVLSSGLLRYAFIIAGLALPWLRSPLPASQRRRVIAVVQVIALIAALAPFVPAAAGTLMAAVALAALTFSFALDVLWSFQIAARSRAVPGQ